MFGFLTNDQRGYTRGSLDVITAINLFLKFLLISPILLFAGYVSIAMMKHVIFHGVPSMNKPTEAQQERLREADAQLGMPVEEKKEVVAPVVSEAPPVVPVVPARPATPENREVTTFWVDGQTGETQTMRTSQEFIDRYCTQWISKYGNNPNAIHAGGPCDAYR